MDRKTNTWLIDVKRLQKEAEYMKSAQLIGAGSLVAYKTFTNNNSDYDTTLTSSAQERFLRLTFTHDTAENGALLELKLFYRINNSNVLANPVDPYTPVQPAIFVRYYKEVWNLTGNTTSWRIRLVKNFDGDPYTAYFKFFIDGTDSGSWNVTVI